MTRYLNVLAALGALLGATVADARHIAFPGDVRRSTSHIEFRNVRDLGAKGDGVHDDTAAFKQAFAARKAPPHEWVMVYVPRGTYRVTDTIGWPRRGYLIGEQRDKTVIKLADACDGFTRGKGKPVVATGIHGNYYGRDSRANAAFANYVMNLTIDTGKGNAGAVGVRYTTHNQGILGDVTIRSGDGAGRIGVDLSSTEFGPGMIRNVTIQGFEIGIETPGNVSHVTLADITLIGQGKVGIHNRFPMSVQGLTSRNRVPAVVNEGGMAHLVLVDGTLNRGSGGHCGIEHRGGTAYIRNVTSSGYRGALGKGRSAVTGSRVAERVAGEVKRVFPAGSGKRDIAVPSPPEPFTEPPSEWKVVEPTGGDDTKAVQEAIDSGAKTLYFKFGEKYYIHDTIHVRRNVRRIIGFQAVLDGRRAKGTFVNTGKPLLKFDGKSKHPITVWGLNVSAWPWNNKIVSIEIDTPQDIYFDAVGYVTYHTTAKASGTVIVDEGIGDSVLEGPGTFCIRQCNMENNPFKAGRSLPRVYLRNKGSRVIALGMKTESPAVHAVTTDGGLTEVLGGFFRDHFGPDQYAWRGEAPLAGVDMGRGVPYWITKDASILASYYQYAWAPGKARGLQAIEIRGRGVKYLTVPPNNCDMGLYMGWNSEATRTFAAGEDASGPERPAADEPETPDPDRPAVAAPEPTPEEQAQAKLSLARSYVSAHMTAKAKTILEKIVKDYPDTKAAKEAKKTLAELD
ncbi:MAG: hypothetical protein KGY99_08240 [Phycisphaerae bacterium]|nr:hypothetical protein [Phycisphaerae bacterium]